MVPFKCDVHGWMQAYRRRAWIIPYFAVTHDGGKFELKNLPAGTYTIEAWHEKLGTQTQTVTLGEKESKEVTFTFKAPPPAAQLIRQHMIWLHRYAKLVAASTVLLIAAGGMVTSTGSGLSVPDWPNTYGWFMFSFPMSKWVGGILYEHSHRLIASTVGFLTIILAVWTWRVEPRAWVRRLGFAALGAVILQGVLGGLTVLLFLPPAVSIGHAGARAALLLHHDHARARHLAVAGSDAPTPARRSDASAHHARHHGPHLLPDSPRRDDAAHRRRAGDSDVSAGIRPRRAAGLDAGDRDSFRAPRRRARRRCPRSSRPPRHVSALASRAARIWPAGGAPACCSFARRRRSARSSCCRGLQPIINTATS